MKTIKTKIELIEIQPLIDMIELTLQSGFIKPYAPVSLLLIANPESCKTESLFKHSVAPYIYYSNEITAKLLVDNVLDRARKKEYRFLVVPDLINCIEKQKTSREAFLNMIKSATAEGIHRIDSFYKRIEIRQGEDPIRIGFITAITGSILHKNKLKKYLEETGILSRFIPFSYSYPIAKLSKIFSHIQGAQITTEKSTFKKISTKEEEIELDPKLAKQLEIISLALGREYGSYGIRAQINLQLLTKANAKINGRSACTQEDIDKIMSLSRWINFGFNPI